MGSLSWRFQVCCHRYVINPYHVDYLVLTFTITMKTYRMRSYQLWPDCHHLAYEHLPLRAHSLDIGNDNEVDSCTFREHSTSLMKPLLSLKTRSTTNHHDIRATIGACGCAATVGSGGRLIAQASVGDLGGCLKKLALPAMNPSQFLDQTQLESTTTEVVQNFRVT